MTDKLSKEEWLGIFFRSYATSLDMEDRIKFLKEAEQAYEQIKSLLFPIPEDKLNEFVEDYCKKYGLHYSSYNKLLLGILKEYSLRDSVSRTSDAVDKKEESK